MVSRSLRRNATNVLLFAYLCLWLFALFNYKSHCIFTMPDTLLRMSQIGGSDEGKCKVHFDELEIAKVDIFDEPAVEDIVARNPTVQKGGWWKPEGCSSWQKVAIIIPYRDRWQHLKKLLHRLHPMLRRQQIHYQVFVIEQRGSDKFNRGKLMNVGFMEAMAYDKFDCFVLHDVDLIPEHDKNYYMCDQHARHLASAIDEMRYHVMYYYYAGGVIALNRENFKRINGYSNSYWGWGNEDDDLSARIQESGLLLTRPPEHIGRFKMVRHHKASRAENGNERFFGWRARWPKDGLNDPVGMNYTVMKTAVEHLYTNITVDIGYPPPDLQTRFESGPKETLLWFLKFYYP
ncbi:beta-1,4-galactosyltransferase 3-like isoform X1 [Haliotis cracherodii]|uniref:beta-1,4-galactosyltransferase 3-like isoform X1 n=1 Tax=Haliotis cracherodii TaxID=6455 RepID=UPI0039E94137